MLTRFAPWSVLALLAGFCLAPTGVRAADDQEVDMKLATFQASGDWKKVKPGSFITAYQFEIKPVEGDENPATLTFTSAGGGAEPNIKRWYGQFTQPDGGSTEDRAKVEKKEIAGLEVYLVDISGTFKERQGGGPFAGGKTVDREKYRMLAAIVDGKIFIKLYGPEKTVAEQQKAFTKMVEGLKRP